MPNFVFIAAGQKLAKLGYRFRETLAFPASFTVVETKMEDAVDYCLHKLPEGTDAIIARGNTANMLRTARIPVPVVTLPIKDSELIRSITTANALYPEEGSRIAYIGLEDVIRSVSEFLKMIHREIRFFQIHDSRDIKNCIRQAKQEQIQVVIGGEYTKELAEAQGLCCVLLESTESSLKEAYERALEIQKGVLLQKKKLQEKLILMNAISDVIVGLNEKGRVSLFNQAAEALFSKKETQIVGKAASSLFGTEELAIINRTLLRGDEVLSHPATLSGQKRLLDFRPVMIHGQSKGVIIRIHTDAPRNTDFPQYREDFHDHRGNFFHEILGQSPVILSACALSARFAPSTLPVLITGEIGTGRTAFAHRIHSLSPQKDGIFLVREGALLTPEDLMAANGGSLCIHDVDIIPASMVPVLNHYLEQGTIALPDRSLCPADVRILATVTIPFSGLKQNAPTPVAPHGNFCPDFGTDLQSKFPADLQPLSGLDPRLYYNLNALTLTLPPLRERTEDIWTLFSAMLEEICLADSDQGSPILPDTAAAKLLTEYLWPGNLRELQSIARRFSLLAANSTVSDPQKQTCGSDPSGAAASSADSAEINSETCSNTAKRNLEILRICLKSEAMPRQPASHSTTATANPTRILSEYQTTKNIPSDPAAGTFSSDKNFVIHGRLLSWAELKALDQYYQGHRGLLAKQLGISRSTLWRYFKEMEG